MLEAAIALQLASGDYTEAGVVVLLLLSNAALGFFQEGQAQATLDALKSRLALVASARSAGTRAPRASSDPVGDGFRENDDASRSTELRIISLILTVGRYQENMRDLPRATSPLNKQRFRMNSW
jgi:hypothetical protein